MSGSAKSNSAPLRPFWIRLIHTPVRDLARMRVTGLFDVKGLIFGSRLPEAIQKTIVNVVRRTRLFRREKVRVAEELIDDFSAGLSAGRSPEQLIAMLGSPIWAARRIRRRKIFGRPRAWRLLHRFKRIAWTTAFWISFILYFGLWLRFLSAHPTPTWNGVAEANGEALAIPKDQRAWPLYRAALLRLRPFPGDYVVASPDYS